MTALAFLLALVLGIMSGVVGVLPAWTIEASVTDAATGAGIAGATVTLARQTVLTDPDGHFAIDATGEHIMVRAPGYRRATVALAGLGEPVVLRLDAASMRSPVSAILYPGVALVEGSNVSVGRGTGRPFEFVGAPWIDGPALAQELARRAIAGVRFAPVDFTPVSDRYSGEPCHGVRIILVDRAAQCDLSHRSHAALAACPVLV
jgi:hypothetical protein